jgi:hypothetical protein
VGTYKPRMCTVLPLQMRRIQLKAKDDESIFSTYTSNLAEMIRDNRGWALSGRESLIYMIRSA